VELSDVVVTVIVVVFVDWLVVEKVMLVDVDVLEYVLVKVCVLQYSHVASQTPA
jgi:hypothetical protein